MLCETTRLKERERKKERTKERKREREKFGVTFTISFYNGMEVEVVKGKEARMMTGKGKGKVFLRCGMKEGLG